MLDRMLLKFRKIELVESNGYYVTEQQVGFTYVLLLVKSGRGVLILDGTSYPLQQDRVYICVPGQTYQVLREDRDNLPMFFLYFDVFHEGERVKEQMEYVTRGFPLQGRVRVYPTGEHLVLCEQIYHFFQSADSLERFRCQLIFQELLYELWKSHHHLQENPTMGLALAKEYMERKYNENLTIEQLAKIAEISPKYFVDLFKKTYGTSAIGYLTQLRINRAKELMVDSQARLRDIAQQVGYNDEFYFSRKFKKEVGMAPAVYRKKYSSGNCP